MVLNLSKVLRESRCRGRGRGACLVVLEFQISLNSNFLLLKGFLMVLMGADNFLVAAALVDAVLSVLLVLPDFYYNSFSGSLDDPERGGELSKRMRLGEKFICELPLRSSSEGFKFQI